MRNLFIQATTSHICSDAVRLKAADGFCPTQRGVRAISETWPLLTTGFHSEGRPGGCSATTSTLSVQRPPTGGSGSQTSRPPTQELLEARG